MKKFLSMVLALCLMLGCASFAAGEQVSDGAAVRGVDAVVVLDMTNSMVDDDNGRKGNDNFNYRLDATSMLIGMLDMNGSRVAIVPFAGEPLNVTELTAVTTTEQRKALVEKIYRDRNTKPNTNIGAALMRANKILMDRADQSNQPMIVLLTDGENSINGNYVKVDPSYRWNEENRTIESRGSENYTTQTANDVTREAVNCARAMGYPIYTVALNTDPSSENRGGMSLQNISLETGVTIGSQRANAATADQLPEFFANILADKIGSSVQVTMRPSAIGENLYEVAIPIVNESVQETNIIIPVLNDANQTTRRRSTSHIKANSIKVFNGNQEPAEPTVTKIYNQGFFSMVKIKNPQMAGNWKLQFESEEDPSSISFNLLYNYDIKLAAGVTAGGQSQEFYKTDLLHVESMFMEGDGMTRSSDSELYKDHTDIVGEEYSAWAKITASVSLYRLDDNGNISGDVLLMENMEPDSVRNLFEKEIDLSQVTPRLVTGKYLLRVSADGAGLTRQVDIPMELKNHEPYTNGDYEYTIHVNPLDSTDRWTSQSTSGKFDKLANEIILDEDGDQMRYSLQPDGGSQVASLSMSGEEIRFITQEADQRVVGGDAVYTLYYTDDESPQRTVKLTLHIISEVDQLLQTYTPELKLYDPADPAAEKSSFSKNSPILAVVSLKKPNGEAAGEELMNRLSAELVINKNGNPWDTVEMTQNGSQMEYILATTGNEAAEWKFQATLKYYDPVEAKATVANDGAPQPVTAAPLEILYNADSAPGFLQSLAGKNTPENDPKLKVVSKDLFSDTDHDELDYSEPIIVAPGTQSIIKALKAEPVSGEEKTYMIRITEKTTGLFSYSYRADLQITATDGDGLTGTYERNITVVDLYNRLLTRIVIVLIIIVLLVILFLIIHQIRKPKFPRLNMTIREEPSLYETSSAELSPVKTPTNANAIGVDNDIAAKHNISMELLQNTVIKPLRSITSVGVRYTKAVGGHEVMLDDVRMKAKKWYTWSVGQELSIRNISGEGSVAIKLEDRIDQQDDGDITEFGEEDSWTSGDFEAPAADTGKKRSHRVERRQSAPAEQQTQSSSGNDDFDF